MNFSRLQARYAIWEDSPVGRLSMKVLPLSLFAAVAIASIWYLEGKIGQFTAVQDDQNTVILAQKKRIEALEQRLNLYPSPVPAAAATPASPND